MNPIIKDLQEVAKEEKISKFQSFFKTGKGEYGEGDIFIGISVPENRKVVKKHKNASLEQIQELLQSKIHEHRLCGLLIMVDQYQKTKQKEDIFNFYLKNISRVNNWDLVDSSADKIIGAHIFQTDKHRLCGLLIMVDQYQKTKQKEDIFNFYLKNISRVNNWDLVDSSADKIIGAHIFQTDKKLIYKLVESKNLWERRIAVISTFYFIKKGQFQDTLKIAEILLNDDEDLIHKAVGWMLREMGKKGGMEKLIEFLDKNSQKMPRTMLRYSIEKLDEEQRRRYLNKK
jgi:3-methyladenine DNA glycosylase AlkD